MCEHFDRDYDEDYEDLADDCEKEKRKIYDEEDDDDIIFFFSPEYGYGYAEDEEDCNDENNDV